MRWTHENGIPETAASSSSDPFWKWLRPGRTILGWCRSENNLMNLCHQYVSCLSKWARVSAGTSLFCSRQDVLWALPSTWPDAYTVISMGRGGHHAFQGPFKGICATRYRSKVISSQSEIDRPISVEAWPNGRRRPGTTAACGSLGQTTKHLPRLWPRAQSNSSLQ
ncbi:hypothetical protein VFPPC_16644 [Pochonia chlamydosporia 170]|uniref:Uncharacterized protein n=1 Tax=Pochonia chlamydosporia 170 TaxID=1380566 RepID=A0A179FA38_METCM|nr:hypothetical protein VFPPC_16644 [Pochonia chlamydosporia 170]OAQ62334.1 hypothetical protein VFPPC_16644 [Pochonia chlamydosporia 170]